MENYLPDSVITVQILRIYSADYTVLVSKH